MRFRKVYGEARSDGCIFCNKPAVTENIQGLPSCIEHKQNKLDDKRCVCGEYMDIKKSKWGAFFLCKNCGPISISKAAGMESAASGGCGYKLNKKYREMQEKAQDRPKRVDYENRLYTLSELERMWDKPKE